MESKRWLSKSIYLKLKRYKSLNLYSNVKSILHIIFIQEFESKNPGFADIFCFIFKFTTR